MISHLEEVTVKRTCDYKTTHGIERSPLILSVR